MKDKNYLARFILAFSVINAVVIISPAFLKANFPFFPLIHLGDVTDLVTPLILIPLYWLLFMIRKGIFHTIKEALIFLFFAAMLAQGQGMHLSANSIDNFLHISKTSDLFILVNFFDEFLSHYIWFIGTNGLVSLLLYRQKCYPFKEKDFWPALEIPAIIIYGLTYFITTIEAQTSPIAIPFAITVIIWGLNYGKNKLRQQPLLLFFFFAHLLALILIASWALYWGGLPEFSTLGII